MTTPEPPTPTPTFAFAHCQAAVQTFTDKFKLPCAGNGPGFPNPRALAARVQKTIEEVTELDEAVKVGDLPGAADACIDIIYVALGTLCQLSVNGQPLWDAVCAANDQKECGPNFSVVKPAGWKPPDIAQLLRDQGWKEFG